MSVFNSNSVNTIDATKIHLANETNLNDTTKICENRELNENSKAKTSVTTMPAATNSLNATVSVFNSNAPFASDQCSDSEEDFDRTTKHLGAHKWIFNYKDVSSTNSSLKPTLAKRWPFFTSITWYGESLKIQRSTITKQTH